MAAVISTNRFIMDICLRELVCRSFSKELHWIRVDYLFIQLFSLLMVHSSNNFIGACLMRRLCFFLRKPSHLHENALSRWYWVAYKSERFTESSSTTSPLLKEFCLSLFSCYKTFSTRNNWKWWCRLARFMDVKSSIVFIGSVRIQKKLQNKAIDISPSCGVKNTV